MMRTPTRISAGLILAILMMLLVACNGTLDSNVATLNAAATNAASGSINVTLPSLPTAKPPTATLPPNLYDLTISPNETMAHAWGQTYGLPSGSEFTIIATQQQGGQFVVDTLKLNGWQDTVSGGSISVGVGQVRLDLALLIKKDDKTDFGSGTATFQPTLDAAGRIRLNPQGGDFGQLDIPNNLTAAMGDAIYALLTGASNDTLSRVSLTQISLENQIITLTGKVR
jgi:hypothetical protein